MVPLDDRLSRRFLLKSTLAASSALVGASQPVRALAQSAAPTPECRDSDDPTESQIEGPFFKPSSPLKRDLAVAASRAKMVTLQGRVLTRSCRPVSGALLDLWHADENGDYDNSGFRYRGHQFADGAGAYLFRTILPGPYPGRTRHYHLKVQAPQRPILTTQLYFPNERGNDYDSFFSEELLMRYADSPSGASARFDFILNIA